MTELVKVKVDKLIEALEQVCEILPSEERKQVIERIMALTDACVYFDVEETYIDVDQFIELHEIIMGIEDEHNKTN